MKRIQTFLVALMLALSVELPVNANSPAVADFNQQESANPIKVLLIDGQNNHDWKRCSPVMIETLEATGRFVVERVTVKREDVPGFNPDFTKYDVVLSNYNGSSWTEKTKASFVKYIKEGGNLVVVHAADNSFPEWDEYNVMIGLGGWGGRNELDGPYVYWKDGKIVQDESKGRGGSHGAPWEYKVVVREKDHPITRGLPTEFLQVKEELYDRLRGPALNMKVLATGFAKGGSERHEPVLMTINYGKGRIFHTVMGHDHKSMTGVAFQETLIRGTEWAATGNVTFPPVTEKTLPVDRAAYRDPKEIPKANNSNADSTEKDLISWNTQKLSDEFFGEGAYFGDFNKDGKVDVVSGPFWYEGPKFSKLHEYRPAKIYKPEGYSDNFLTFVHDFNHDDWDDILIIGWPGYKEDHEHVWYENPKGKAESWPRHQVFKEVDNESPAFGNLVGDENPELMFHYKGHLGWATPDANDPTKPWTFHKISENLKLTRYAHGLGFGDINGDGRVDFVASQGWWEQPESIEGDPLWKHHTWPFKLDGAQMLVYDVDGDGDNDIVTSIECHKYGIAWLEHTKTEGEISFKMHRFINEKPDENRYGVQFSQPHALDTADFNGDGLIDFVVGKRFWAHGPKGDPEPNAAAVTYWFELKRGVKGVPSGVDFIPHLIHDDSGVGTQVAAGDLNGDGLVDVLSGNKKGTHIHLQTKKKVSKKSWESAQPQLVK